MYEIVEVTNDDFKSVVAIDNLAAARIELEYISKQNPNKEYIILNEQGLKI
jgi:hypothetical protein